MDLQRLLKQYDYTLPAGLIANTPSSPRDHARLLVYNRLTKKVAFDRFYNIGKYLPKNSVLVFNQTKVIPARLKVTKATGGRVEILYLSNNRGLIKTMADRKLTVGTKLTLNTKINFKIAAKEGSFYFLKPNFPFTRITSILEKYGQTPLPPYIKNSPLTEKQRRLEYQSVFAKTGESVAAPTASLHFTKRLITKLKKQGIEVKFLTLNVNLGTFAPLTDDNLRTGKLHLESYAIDKKTVADLKRAKKEGKAIVAVGTTVIRTLESLAATGNLSGPTNLFIRPPYDFKFIDSLITNFHVPKSSLLMLVAALTGRKALLHLYKKAIKKRFRFFSFGDGMLVI